MEALLSVKTFTVQWYYRFRIWVSRQIHWEFILNPSLISDRISLFGIRIMPILLFYKTVENLTRISVDNSFCCGISVDERSKIQSDIDEC